MNKFNEVRAKVIDNLEKAEIVTGNKHPEQLSVIKSFTNLIRSFKDLRYMYWYLNIKYVINTNSNYSRFAWMENEKYNGEQLHTAEMLPKYIEELLGFIPQRPLAIDLKHGDILSHQEIYAIFGKGNNRVGLSTRKEFNSLIVINNPRKTNYNKWIDDETFKYGDGEYDDNGKFVGKPGWEPHLEKLKLRVKNNEIGIFVFDTKNNNQNEFKGKFVCLDLIREKATDESEPRVKFRDYFILKRISVDENIENLETGFDERKHKYLEGQYLNRSINYRGRNTKVREAYLKEHGSKCHLCGAVLKKYNSEDPIIDVHHLHAISLGERETQIIPDCADLVGLCPNCHRWVHSIKTNHEFTFDELKKLYLEYLKFIKGKQ